MKTQQGHSPFSSFKTFIVTVRRVATAPLTGRQLRRVVLVGSLALPISGALLWTSISPVSASPTVRLAAGVTQLQPTTTVDPTTTTTVVKSTRTVTPSTPTDSAAVATATTPTPAPTVKVAPKVTTVTKPVVAPVAKISNPSVNIAPTPNFLEAGQCSQVGGVWSCANPCVSAQLTFPETDDTPACTTYLLEAINNARSVEGLSAMVLPSNWYSLTTPEQLFVVANLERTARQLPPYLGINAALSADSQRAAQGDADPGVASGFTDSTDPGGYAAMGGAWSAGFNVLAADYMWMYVDGWGGSAATTSNVACTTANAAGCWAHRDELLGSDPGFNPGVGLTSTNCEVGVGFAVVNGSGSYVDLIERPAGVAPAMTFTWAQEVAAGL